MHSHLQEKGRPCQSNRLNSSRAAEVKDNLAARGAFASAQKGTDILQLLALGLHREDRGGLDGPNKLQGHQLHVPVFVPDRRMMAL